MHTRKSQLLAEQTGIFPQQKFGGDIEELANRTALSPSQTKVPQEPEPAIPVIGPRNERKEYNDQVWREAARWLQSAGNYHSLLLVTDGKDLKQPESEALSHEFAGAQFIKFRNDLHDITTSIQNLSMTINFVRYIGDADSRDIGPTDIGNSNASGWQYNDGDIPCLNVPFERSLVGIAPDMRALWVDIINLYRELPRKPEARPVYTRYPACLS